MTKIAVLGAAGQIGQPLSLLLKSCPLVSELSLYDIVHAPIDLNHIDAPTKVTGYLPSDDELRKALKGAEIVVIPAGMGPCIRNIFLCTKLEFPARIARKPGMTRDVNASVIRDLATEVAHACPTAFVLIITNPVNSTLPIAAATLGKFGVFNPTKVFGVTTLDVVRANTFTAHTLGMNDPRALKIPAPPEERRNAITYRGCWLSYNMYGLCWIQIRAIYSQAVNGASDIFEETYLYLPGVSGGKEVAELLSVDYFALPTKLGKQGAEKVFLVGEISSYEDGLLNIAIEELKGNVKKGLDFVTR